MTRYDETSSRRKASMIVVGDLDMDRVQPLLKRHRASEDEGPPREPSVLSPAAILVQASSLSWSGGPDRCMRELDGKPLLLRTLERARALFPQAPIHILAPEFDRGGLDFIAANVTVCQA